MQPQTLRPDAVLSASWCRLLCKSMWAFWADGIPDPKSTFLKGEPGCCSWDYLCLSHQKSSSTSVCHSSKCPLEAASKIEFFLGHRNMVLFMFRWLFLNRGRAIPGPLVKFRSNFLPSLPRHPLSHYASKPMLAPEVSPMVTTNCKIRDIPLLLLL